MGWRSVKIKIKEKINKSVIMTDGINAEISVAPVTKDKLINYKQYVYRDKYGYHICIKDPDTYHEGDDYLFIGLTSEHIDLCNLAQIFELRDAQNPIDYEHKEVSVQDLRYRDSVSPKKMEEIRKLRRLGWKILAKYRNVFYMERKKKNKK